MIPTVDTTTVAFTPSATQARLVDEGGRQVEHHPEGVGAVGDDLANGAGLRAVDHHRGTVDDTAGDHGGAHGDVEPVVGDESIDQGREERDDHGDDEEDPSGDGRRSRRRTCPVIESPSWRHPRNVNGEFTPQNIMVSTTSSTTIATRLARIPRPEATPTPSGPPVAKKPL